MDDGTESDATRRTEEEQSCLMRWASERVDLVGGLDSQQQIQTQLAEILLTRRRGGGDYLGDVEDEWLAGLWVDERMYRVPPPAFFARCMD